MATRALLKRLPEELRLPVVGLYDWNPGGMGVYMTYRYGSVKSGLESHLHSTALPHPNLASSLFVISADALLLLLLLPGRTPAVDIKWLGLCWDDIERMHLPSSCLQDQTERDRRRIRSIQASGCLKVLPWSCSRPGSYSRMSDLTPVAQDNPRCERELEKMREAGVKVEIQALSHLGSLSCITSHVVTKAIRRDFV
jgi:DNA topoisomerase VI subunit A